MNHKCRKIMDELILSGELEEITWFKFAPKQELKLRLKDILEDSVDSKYLLNQELVEKYIQTGTASNHKGSQAGKVADETDEHFWTVNAGTHGYSMGYVKLNQTHQLNIKGNDSIKRIYSSDGLCPSLTTMQGGHREPKVAIQKDIIKLFDIPKEILNDNERQRRVYSPDGISPAVIARSDSAKILLSNGLIEVDDEVRVKEAVKKGYTIAEEGDSINIFVPSSKTRRGRVGKQVAQTLDTACNQVVFNKVSIVDDTQGFDGAREYSDYSPTLRAGRSGLKWSQDGFIFRKLTPRECFRLQGFDDSFVFVPKMSDTQLYKQAGNGMSRNILDMIFTQIFTCYAKYVEEKQE